MALPRRDIPLVIFVPSLSGECSQQESHDGTEEDLERKLHDFLGAEISEKPTCRSRKPTHRSPNRESFSRVLPRSHHQASLDSPPLRPTRFYEKNDCIGSPPRLPRRQASFGALAHREEFANTE
ncbi:expressed unknown protein [Seminavis robusta]|uniref:Uncharacterized protein n=1 Tax=Seminavis robusta TaxID=568900 RepID=A0A9N8EXW0_9STRA|nr:expressed unknown protein [Seminavis robusta]|eukprot:Sro2398_g326110.1 n/a (124) ;mRNA; f:6276-6647